MPKKDIVSERSQPSQTLIASEPTRLIELAITQNADIEKLERLMDLQDRWNKDQARRAFYQAVSDFQSEMPIVHKSKTASFPTNNGGKMQYSFASIDDIVRAVNPVLHKNGLSYRFEQSINQGLISVTCILSHALGHSEYCTMSGGLDQTGHKNGLQQIASSTTYLKKYTLSNVTGLATSDDDIDGFQPTGDNGDSQPVSQPASQPVSQPVSQSDYYEDEEFDRLFKGWEKVIQAKRKTPETLIAFVESKNKQLTEQQKTKIRGVK